MALGYALAGTRGPVSAETVAAYARARILAERAGGAESVQAFYGQWSAAGIQGEHRMALALADQMLEIARGVGGSGLLTMGHYAQAVTRHYLGDLAEAGQHFQRAIDHSRDAEFRDIPVDLGVFVLSISGQNEWHLGHPIGRDAASPRRSHSPGA